MARYSTVYSNFLGSLAEVELLRKQAAGMETTDPFGLEKEINALCRGAVVLLSSHVEAFIKELGEHALERLVERKVCRSKLGNQFFYHISKDLFDEIGKSENPEKIALKAFRFVDRDVIHWEKNNGFPDPIDSQRFNKGFSSPKFRKIKTYLRRFGYKTYEGDLKSRLKNRSSLTVNMIDQLVDTRNLIAHGDPSATKTPSDIKEILDITTLFCRTTDDVFCTWFRSEFCSLR